VYVAVVAQSRAHNEPQSAQSCGKASIVLSIIGIIVGILILILIIVVEVLGLVSIPAVLSD